MYSTLAILLALCQSGSLVYGADDETPLAEHERFLEPYVDDLVSFRDNEIAKRFITLSNLVDVVPTWLIDLFVPLVIPDSTLNLDVNVKLPIPGFGKFPGVPPGLAHLEINHLSINKLDEFKKLKPIKYMDNTRYTWAGNITWKESAQTNVELGARLVVAGAFSVGVNLSLTLQEPALDFALVMGLDRAKMCEVWGHVLQSSVGCAVHPMFASKKDRVSGVKLSSLGIKAADFTLDSIKVKPLPGGMSRRVEQMLQQFIVGQKSYILSHMSDQVSGFALGAINTGLYQEIQAIHKFFPCERAVVAPVPKVSRVCFVNNAAFVMKWGYANCPVHDVSVPTKPFAIGQNECVDVKDVWPTVQQGDVLRATTEAVAGMHEIIDPSIEFQPDSNTATYQCDGTTLMYKCSLVSVAPIDPVAPIPASKICVLNHAAFVLNFDAQNLRTEGWMGKSRNLPVTDKHCLDLKDTVDVKEGDAFQTKIHAVAGKNYQPRRVVEYSADGFEVTFSCRGTTLNFKCEVIDSVPRKSNVTTTAPDQELETTVTTTGPGSTTTEDAPTTSARDTVKTSTPTLTDIPATTSDATTTTALTTPCDMVTTSGETTSAVQTTSVQTTSVETTSVETTSPILV